MKYPFVTYLLLGVLAGAGIPVVTAILVAFVQINVFGDLIVLRSVPMAVVPCSVMGLSAFGTYRLFRSGLSLLVLIVLSGISVATIFCGLAFLQLRRLKNPAVALMNS